MQGRAQEFLTAGPALVADVLARFGCIRMRALGTSMLPTIRSGDVLDVHRCSSHQLQDGDIVLVNGSAGLRAHRMVARRCCGERSVVVTRGDAHWRRDGVDPAAEVLGRVVRVTRATASPAVSLDCPMRNRLRGLAENEWSRIAASFRRALYRIVPGTAISAVR
jgi:hypothetical protein